ncbi:von Willebrand factor D and EGF domain-containing protein-like [Ptychodera flava]|uniref:von Willebrand factor D and EGF domain-containing protein-like n=1 Tax=Ptychodera flava TaxID=63121 RepID=UPI00396A1574
MQGPPVLEGPILTHGTFHFKCTVDLADQYDQAARCEVSWLFDGETHDDVESVILHVNSLSTLIPGEVFSYRKGRLGVMVGCRARSFYENFHKSHWYASDNYFVGIKVSTDDPLVLSESDGLGTTIPIWSTIPILCEDLTYMTACRINILAQSQGEETEDDYFHEELSFDSCDIAIAPRDWDETSKTATTEFTIVARRDFMDDGVRNVTIRSRVLPPDCVNSSYVSIFDGYEIQPIQVSVIGVDHKRCSSFGDPHYRTFDGLWYTMLKTGYFVLLRGTTDKGSILEVQTAATDCAEVSCNCAVAIRENNDLVIMDICNRDSLRISVPSKNLSPGTAIHQQYGNKHYVYMYSGVTLEVRLVSSAQGKWLDVFVVLPSDYTGRTMALCGDGDDDDTNDFTKRNGEITEDLDDFAESWRVLDEENLFLRYDRLSWIPESNIMYCNCPTGIDSFRICCGYGLHTDQLRLGTDMTHLYANGTTGHSEKSCLGPLYGSVAIHAESPQCIEKTDQENVRDDYVEAGDIRFEYDSEFKPSIPEWPTPSGITEGMALEFCGQFLSSNSIYSACIEKTNLNTQKYNETCVIDIQATDTRDFAPSTAAAFLFDCMDLVLRNISLYDKDGQGNKVPPQDLITMLCPSDCSKHGECIDNICVCDKGFTGSDCSYEKGQPIHLSNLKHDALCDLQSRPCETAFGVGENFVKSERLMCKVKLTSQNNHISVYYTEAYLISSTEIACPLKHTGINTYPATVTNNELPVEYSHISFSLDGITFSNELLFTVFDSVCVECTESGSCDKKGDSCLIDGLCFAEGNQHRLEPGKYCDAANDEFGWTEKDIIWTTDSANWTEPTTTSPGESGAPNSSGGWQIFLGFVGGVIFGAAVICE